MRSFPVIKDPGGDFPCEECPGGQRLLHRVPRSPVTRPITNSGNEDVLLDEAGIPILDEVTSNVIFDSYPHTLL